MRIPKINTGVGRRYATYEVLISVIAGSTPAPGASFKAGQALSAERFPSKEEV